MFSRHHNSQATLLILYFTALFALGTSALAQSDEPPFEWDLSFSSPGTSLSVEVLQASASTGSVLVTIKSTGFSRVAGPVVLWQRTRGEYDKYEPKVRKNGTVRLIPRFNEVVLGGYLRGQPFDIAIVDEATKKRAQTKLIPFPITAEGEGGCQASAEVLTETALVWSIFLTGYKSGEQVTITSVSEKETLTNDFSASESGEIVFPVLFPNGSNGNAKFSAKGSGGCSVSLEYAIGESAL